MSEIINLCVEDFYIDELVFYIFICVWMDCEVKIDIFERDILLVGIVFEVVKCVVLKVFVYYYDKGEFFFVNMMKNFCNCGLLELFDYKIYLFCYVFEKCM